MDRRRTDLVLSSLAEVSLADLGTHVIQNIVSVQSALVLEHSSAALLRALVEAHIGRITVIELDVNHEVSLLLVGLSAAVDGTEKFLLLAHGDILIVIFDRHDS